jgi:hypothetical protein
VTTTADVVDVGDGALSLREAVTQADASDGVADTIQLQAGATYQLTRCTAEPDPNNVAGDLDSIATARVTIQGSGTTTIEQTCDGERLFDTFGSPITLRGLILTGGDHDDGAVVRFSGDLELDGVAIQANQGQRLVYGTVAPSYDVEVVDSRFEAAPGNRVGLSAGANAVTISGSVFRELESTAVSSSEVGGQVFVSDSTFTDNATGGTPAAGGAISAEGPIHVSGSSFLRNHGTNGSAIRGRDFLIDVDTSTFTDNEVTGFIGAAIYSIDLNGDPGDNDVDLSHVTMWDNTKSGNGNPANVDAAGQLTSFASIVGQPTQADSCVVGSGTSTGHSFDSGDSCGFDDEPSDVDGITDLGLTLQPGDGPHERVLVPGFLSPAVDRIPNGDCTGTILDQLGELRPSDGDFDGEAACDVGAVERPLLPVFTDVSAAHPFFEEIGWMGWQGISTGSLPGPVYKPSDPVSRQAMSAFLYRLANASFVGGAPTFSDVGPSNPFFDEIEWMNSEGITTGFGGGLFKPLAAVSRQAMAAFMHRMAGEPLGPFPDPGFSDVSGSHPFSLPIGWMAHTGISEGYDGGTFKPSVAVSRQAMAAFMQRFAQQLPD